MADELVRVRMDAGDEWIEKNLGRVFAEQQGLEVLDESPYLPDGSLRREQRTRKRSGRPSKQKVSVADQAAAKKAAPEPRDSAEEASE